MRTPNEAKAFLRELYAAHFGEAPQNFEGKMSFDGSSTNQVQPAQTLNAAVFASAPGRIELAGNHTDHQGGCTISAAIDARMYALAVPNKSNTIRVYMDGFGKVSLELNDLAPHADEKETSLSLIRGMAAAYAQTGNTLHGFDMVMCSDIPVGSGLSSSAAFEVLVAAVLRALDGKVGQLQAEELTALALEGMQVEQTYFGKPCGAQDQLASAHGGIALLDFSEDIPQVSPLEVDLAAVPYKLILVDSQCDHSQYTNEFAAVSNDMFAVAQFFGGSRLGDVAHGTVLEQLAQARVELGDRAVLRALHYYEETERVKTQAQALSKGNFELFLELLRLSGASSAQFLQNVSPRSDQQGLHQPVMAIYALCSHLLSSNRLLDQEGRRGAYRIVGGGFGGSVLAFVPTQTADMFEALMNALLGYDACSTYIVGTPGVYSERFA